MDAALCAAALMTEGGCADGGWLMADGDESKLGFRHLPSAICHPAKPSTAISEAAIGEAYISNNELTESSS